MKEGDDLVINIQFQICGLVILILVAALYVKRRTIWINTDRIFGVFIAITLFSTIADIASIYTINFRDSISPLFNEFVCKLYLYTLTLASFITLIYLVAEVCRNDKRFFKLVGYMSLAMVAVGVAYIFLPIEYHVNKADESIYTLGPAVIYTYVVSVILLVLSVTGNMVFGTHRGRYRHNPVTVILTTFIIAAGIQFVNNQILIVSFAESVAVLLIYLFMENPADKMDEETGFYTSGMLKAYIDRQYMMGERFFIVAFSVNSYDVVTRTFGINNAANLLKNVAVYLRELDEVQLFRLGEYRFAIAGSYENEEIFNNVMRYMNEIEKKEFAVSNTQITINTDICVFNDSELLNNSDEVLYCINSILSGHTGDGIIDINKNSLEDVNWRSSIEDTLRWAIDNDKFMVYYQPIYSIEKQCFVSFEALVRLWDEKGTFIAPDEFIPIAEQNGLIADIDMIVLKKVCRFINDTDPNQYGIKYIEVNLSAVQCMNSGFAADLKRVMDDYGVPIEYIHFEITETAMANSKQSLSDNMHKLIGLGSAFFLDDYGSGYANLNFLIDFPFRAVKLDKELVWSFFNNKKGEIATRFSIDMLKSLDMEIVAEGIETKEQFNAMKDFEVEYIQGYYFSRPLNENDVIDFVRNSPLGAATA